MCNVIPDYVDALIKEIHLKSDTAQKIDTIYFGGGTPSVLESNQIKQIYEAIKYNWDIDPHAEITLEANPGTITADKLFGWKSSGINRINMGIQSFHDKHLKQLGRIHTAYEAQQAVHLAQNAEFKNIGLDFIYGVPEQTLDEWEQDLKKAISFHPKHLSCYSLTYEPGTLLYQKMKSKAIVPLLDEIVVQMIKKLLKVMDKNGFDHYETSNFASTPDFRSKHNQKYWQLKPYIGIGAASHSFSNNRRYWNYSDVTIYIKKLSQNLYPTEGCEELTSHQQMIEFLFLGLRTQQGIFIKEFERRFSINFSKIFSVPLENFTKDSYIEYSSDYCKLTRTGWFYLDSIVEQMVNCLTLKKK
ncbi:putative oxygen-independent coproporphyrinogen III oxidase [Candidatus Magnetomorum sp. HK-1]|nr:putative oxygen-independent coproporphyrinogen III oxidase [Candidatus Magnetomorum sp. HK-1]